MMEWRMTPLIYWKNYLNHGCHLDSYLCVCIYFVTSENAVIVYWGAWKSATLSNRVAQFVGINWRNTLRPC